jgi:hypothetical protein
VYYQDKKTRQIMANHLSKMQSPLLTISKHDVWTLEDAYAGTFICGGIGSGKTSGSGRTIAHSFLRAGFGGLVLCAKVDEADTWRKYCKETGREKSLFVIDGTGNRRFNFLEYELARIDGGGNSTNFALEALLKIYEAMQIADGVKGDESFWRNSVRLLLSHSIDMLYMAYGRLCFPELMAFIRQMPPNGREYHNEDWQSVSFHFKTLMQAATNIQGNEAQTKVFQTIRQYYQDSFYNLDQKTKSNILATLEAMVMDFQKGELANIFCTDTNIVPEMSHHGAVIVLDFPLKNWQRGGQLAQHIFKFAWQKAIERRRVEEKTRPCFLWADEYQLFASSYDAEFQSTARSSRACSVFMTQSVPALREAVKSAVPKDTVDALLNNFQTKIMHTCTDYTTQVWAAEIIGKGLQWEWSDNWGGSQGANWSAGDSTTLGNTASTSEQRGQGSSHNKSWGWHWFWGKSVTPDNSARGSNLSYSDGSSTGTSYATGTNRSRGASTGSSWGRSKRQKIDFFVQPSFFSSGLRTGGERHGFQVDGVMMQGGRIWRCNGSSFVKCTFSQE